MGWLGVALSAAAAWLLWDNGGLWLASAIVVGVIELWSWGIMHNYATDAAKQRSGYTGGFHDFTAQEVNTVPNWISTINLIGFVMAIAVFVAGLIV